MPTETAPTEAGPTDRVIVVGAGPVGMVTALGLGRALLRMVVEGRSEGTPMEVVVPVAERDVVEPLDVRPERPHGGGRIEHILGLQQACDTEAPGRHSAEHQRPVRDRLVARNPHHATHRAGSPRQHRLRRGAVGVRHDDIGVARMGQGFGLSLLGLRGNAACINTGSTFEKVKFVRGHSLTPASAAANSSLC